MSKRSILQKKPVVVELKGIGKKYRLFDHETKKKFDYWALKDISVKIKKGQKIGLIGPNGAGKSTLLKIIAGITQHSCGQKKVSGRIVSLTELEAGFRPELSGRENIMLNGLLIGMTMPEVREKMEKIIAFADIDDFINQPFFTYSAGMKFRLAFSIATASDCDILIIDEVFLAGDFNFQKKTIEKLKQLQKSHTHLTTIISSHIPNFIWSFSNVFFRLNKGRIKKIPRKQVWEELVEIDHAWQERFSINLHDARRGTKEK